MTRRTCDSCGTRQFKKALAAGPAGRTKVCLYGRASGPWPVAVLVRCLRSAAVDCMQTCHGTPRRAEAVT